MKRTLIYVAIIALLLAAAYLMRERYDNYAAALNDVGQTAGYTNLNNTTGAPNTGIGNALAGAPPGTTGTTASGATTGNTTGGSTTNRQPTSGGTSGGSAGTSGGAFGDSQTVAGIPGNNVFGPPFVGVGANANDGNLHGPVPYPYLYGPKPDSSTFVEGAGIVQPSQAATLKDSGALPSSKGTGSDKNSQFFGASRVPGDKDIVPNPYGTNTAFSPSSGSSKTEPLPYLTDFSAFGK
jgi:hypothetical protein